MSLDENHFELAKILAETPVVDMFYAPVLPSTNDWVHQQPDSQRFQTPFLVLTSEQTRGRGRHRRDWFSSPGSLTFSIVIDCHTANSNADSSLPPLFSLAAGVAVDKCLRSLTPGPFAIKWPNDVYLGDKKICGILIEPLSGESGQLVVGCGININNSFTEGPRPDGLHDRKAG